MPAPSNFFQKTIQFSFLVDDHNSEPGTFLFPPLCYNEVLMQLKFKHMGWNSHMNEEYEQRGGHFYRTANKYKKLAMGECFQGARIRQH